MMTRSELIRSVYRERDLGSLDNILRQYGEQVREECAKIAENTSRSDFDNFGRGRSDLAEEIRALELP